MGSNYLPHIAEEETAAQSLMTENHNAWHIIPTIVAETYIRFCSVSDIVLSASVGRTHFIHITTSYSFHYSTHFIDEDAEVQRD